MAKVSPTEGIMLCQDCSHLQCHASSTGRTLGIKEVCDYSLPIAVPIEDCRIRHQKLPKSTKPHRQPADLEQQLIEAIPLTARIALLESVFGSGGQSVEDDNHR
jgi:hypothetical protein